MRETEITYDTTQRAISRKDIWEGTSLSQGRTTTVILIGSHSLSMVISVLFPV